MNTQPRVFRGRGGPTDGRLPKHNARRRKQKKATKPAVNKYGDDDAAEDDASSLEIVDEIQPFTESAPPNPTPAAEEEEEEPWKREIKHLRKRIGNVQESIQTGTLGMGNPKVYQENVLNAVQNCLNEWRAILKQYEVEPEATAEPLGLDDEPALVVGVEIGEVAVDDNSQNELDGSDSSASEEEEEEVLPTSITTSTSNFPTTSIDPSILKETSLQVYMLFQLSVQCGPLQGGKPGYFKRCGGTVAKMVLDYLNQVVPTEQVCFALAFSPKQANAIEGWRKNAHKAALQDKAPSKTALQKQEGKSKKKKLQKKRK